MSTGSSSLKGYCQVLVAERGAEPPAHVHPEERVEVRDQRVRDGAVLAHEAHLEAEAEVAAEHVLRQPPRL